MKSVFHWLVLWAGIVVWNGTPADLFACPCCNIHNYLAASVRSSTEIRVVRVAQALGTNEARVDIIRVLRGSAGNNRTANIKLWAAQERSGQTLILCNPISWPPNFDSLPLELEEEVTWLIGTDRPDIMSGNRYAVPQPFLDLNGKEPDPTTKAELQSVKTFEDCLQRIQGVSNESRRAGFVWLKTQENFPAGRLIAAIRTARADLVTQGQTQASYRLSCLVEALTLSSAPEVQRLVQDETAWCLMHLGGAFSWANRLQVSDWRAAYLAALVDSTTNTWRATRWANFTIGLRPDLKTLRVKVVNQVVTALPVLKDFGLSQAVYALTEQGLVPG